MPRLLAPTTLDELRAGLESADEPVVVGGAVGLMSAAFAPAFGETNIDLRRMGLDWVDSRSVGAMASLASLERSALSGRQALADALRLTATPALRRRITVGGVLGGGSSGSDLTVALGVHSATAKVLNGRTGKIERHLVIDLLRLPRPWVVLEVHLGRTGESRYARFSGHHRAAPALVGVAARRTSDESALVCVGGVAAAPELASPDKLLRQGADADDAAASAGFRGRIVRTLVTDICSDLGVDAIA